MKVRFGPRTLLLLMLGAALALAVACAGETVVETVVVEKMVPGEKVVETVIVEKMVPGEKVVETVVVVATPMPSEAKPPAAKFSGELVHVTPGLGLQIMDPGKDSRGSGAVYQVPMWDNLLGYDVETGAIAPGIAETWKQSSDGLTWSFKLREGLEWHNGDPVTTADIAFSAEYYQSDESTVAGGPFQNLEITTTVHDDLNIDLHAKLNQIFFSMQLSPCGGGQEMMLPKKYIEEVGSMEEFARKPVGSGPWKFAQQQPGILVQFEAWDYPHWRGTPHFELYTLRAVPEESTRVAMLRTGAAGIADITPDSFAEVKSSGLELISVLGAVQATYVIEGTYAPEFADSPLTDIRVREALSLAINRQEIVDYIMEGAADLPLPYGVYRYSQDIDPNYWEKWSAETFRYDPDRARELLAEAGYGDGFTFPYWLTALPGTPWQIPVGEAIIGYWKEVGISTEVRQVEWGVFSPKRRQYNPETGVPVELGGTIKGVRAAGRPNTGTRLLGELGDCNMYTPPRDPPGGGAAGSYQIVTEACHEVMRLWYDEDTGVLMETDPMKRYEMYPEALKYTASLWLGVPIIEGTVNYAIDPQVVGKFTGTPGSGELGDMSSSIPRADESPW